MTSTLRTRLLLGAGLLLLLGLGLEWGLRPAPAAPVDPAAQAASEAARAGGEAAASAALQAAPPAATPEPLTSQPPAREQSAEEAALPTDTAAQNDPIEPELPQTPAWKLEKTAHVRELMDRQVARLEAERQAAVAAGKPEDAKRLEVAVARAQRRLGHLQEEIAKLQAQAQETGAQ
ncbi:hypothetical protein FGE12_04420 [Aggregicoccus sp. 17bor-14]|uniref:hypothetical protein n=1 Tax=Myxococcaceae TaxID=31 RepID=UPI00129C39CA|nr:MULTISPECIES: hypothetical protein [Myxococcaceae]MBF5041621.1 hypothetical protein [Simulacricoccus sp. 17bor-14]MRI87406.1 hypothetical protein [Aggregicoccus sp. 17bor-14]